MSGARSIKQSNPYESLATALAKTGWSCYRQNPDQLVVSAQQGPARPDRGNSFWLSHKKGAWHLSTWLPAGYGVPVGQDLVALCSACMAVGESAMYRVPADLVARFQPRELDDAEYEQLSKN